MDGTDFGGASALSVREDASVDAEFRVAVWNFLRGIVQKLRDTSTSTEASVSVGQT